MILSVSTDGHYAISTNSSKQAVLWNIKDKDYKIISNNANIYSAYFVKNTNNFIYQDDKTNEVILENINGTVIKKLNPGFATYGEVMTSDLNTWIGSDDNYQTTKITNGIKQVILYYYCGPNYHDAPIPPQGALYRCGGVLGAGKLLNYTLSSDDKYLIGSGFGDVFLWNISTDTLVSDMQKNDPQVYATFSPDSAMILSGDIGSHLYAFSVNQQNLIAMELNAPKTPELAAYFLDNNIQDPQMGVPVVTIKYIDSNNFFVFISAAPDSFNYAILYNLADKKSSNSKWYQYNLSPRKYIPLIKGAATDFNYDPTWPMTTDYARDEAIDTSPSAHILVMAMDGANGILVYHYDPATQELTNVWSPQVSWWRF